jgi:hypothetical protein
MTVEQEPLPVLLRLRAIDRHHVEGLTCLWAQACVDARLLHEQGTDLCQRHADGLHVVTERRRAVDRQIDTCAAEARKEEAPQRIVDAQPERTQIAGGLFS